MDSKQLQTMLDELETDVERLKALYQQYFMGFEKLPPATLRKKVDRIFWQLRRERFPTTGSRFKFHQILQRYNTYEQYWGRVLRQIENGTYKRDVIRAAKLVGADAARAALGKAMAGQDVDRALSDERDRNGAWSLDPSSADWDDDDAKTPPHMRVSTLPDGAAQHAQAQYPQAQYPQAQYPQAQYPQAQYPQAQYPQGSPGNYPGLPTPTAQRAVPSADDLAQRMRGSAPPPLPGAAGPQRPLPPPRTGGPPLPPRPAGAEDRTRQIFNEYVDARRRSGESVDGLTYERVAKSLSDQSDKLRAQHPNRKLDFEVVQKDGKAVIRPVVK